MNTEHTPGSLEVKPPENGNLYFRIRGTQIGKRYKVANVLFAADTPEEMAEAKANAYLFCSAPDLLEALEEIVEYNREQAKYQYGNADRAETWACVKTARAAIAKARGKEGV